MQILEELYSGNIRPDVRFYGKDTPFAELARLRQRNKDKLLESFNENEKELFEKFDDAQSEIDSITRFDKFSYGFRLGVLVMAEAFTGAEEMVGCNG